MAPTNHHFLHLGPMPSVRASFEDDLRAADDRSRGRFPSNQNDAFAHCRSARDRGPVIARFLSWERREKAEGGAGVHTVGQEIDQLLTVIWS
jgi:hypothetical protein